MANYTSATYNDRVYENNAINPLIDMVPPTASSVLDIGCGVGTNLWALTQRGHECMGVTASLAEAETVKRRGLQAILADCTQPLPFPPCSFDAVILCHVLEHLPWPEKVIESLKPLLRENGAFYCAVPNVAFLNYRLRLAMGEFPRHGSGIWDKTHLRWFTWSTIPPLAASSGCALAFIDGDAWFRDIPYLPYWVGRSLVRFLPNLFSKQIRFVLPLVKQARYSVV